MTEPSFPFEFYQSYSAERFFISAISAAQFVSALAVPMAASPAHQETQAVQRLLRTVLG